MLSVSIIALELCIQSPNTINNVAAAHVNVIRCLSNFSEIIRTNIEIKMITASICDIILYLVTKKIYYAKKIYHAMRTIHDVYNK
jgi:hypothetical protein